ncbi:MAG: hypothetical protein WBG30_10270 [Psychrilyobacter sp.]|uniref:hypothetical protein n=1 Tax=Psychrilyobacter sp. TaxID=2586924 RepID=UPI003C71E751
MRYNLLKKEATPTWEEAKEKLIKSIFLNENRVGEEYIKAFPYDYDPEIHFVHEGELTKPYIIQPDFTLYFLNEREQVEKGYKVLGDGEIIEGDTIKIIPSPTPFYEWKVDKWVYNKGMEIESIEGKIRGIERELEATQARKIARANLGIKTKYTDLDIEISKLLQLHADACQELTLI